MKKKKFMFIACFCLIILVNFNYVMANETHLFFDDSKKIDEIPSKKWFSYIDVGELFCSKNGGYVAHSSEKATLFYTKDFGLTNVTLLKVKHIFHIQFLGLIGHAKLLIYDSDGMNLLYESVPQVTEDKENDFHLNGTIVFDVPGDIVVGDSFYVAIQSMLHGSTESSWPFSCGNTSTQHETHSYFRDDNHWNKLSQNEEYRELSTAIYVEGDPTPVQLSVKTFNSLYFDHIENVLITLTPKNNNKELTCATNDEGICLFENLLQGDYLIDINKKNYLPIHDELNLTGYRKIEYGLQETIGNCISLNNINTLLLCADKIENEQFGVSSINTIKASGNVNINDIIHFDGVLEWKKNQFHLKGNTAIYLKEIGLFEKIILYEGEFQFSAHQTVMDVLNDIQSSTIPISLPLQIEAIEVLNDGIRIEGQLKLPQVMDNLDIEVNTLQLTQSKGITLEGEMLINDVKIHKTISLEEFKLKFNTDEKTFEGEAKLKAKLFDIEAKALIKQSKLESVKAFVEPLKPIPVGSTGFSISGGGGGLGGISTPPMILSLGVGLVPTVQGTFEIVKLNHLELEYTFGKQIKGTGIIEIFSKDIASASIIITKSSIKLEADVELMNMLVGHTDASLSKAAENDIIFEGNLNASLLVPEEEGFPFDLMECFVNLPYTFAKTENHIKNSIITGSVVISQFFALKYLLEWQGYNSYPMFKKTFAPNFTIWNKKLFNNKFLQLNHKKRLYNRFEGQSLVINKNNSKVKNQKIQQHFSLDNISPNIIIRVAGQKNIPDPALILPDGNIVNSSNVDNYWNIELTQNISRSKIFYLLSYPQIGNWTLELIEDDIYDIDVYKSNAPPAIKIIDIKQSNQIVNIFWVDSDYDSDARLNLYYDDDNNGTNGTPIVSNISENDLLNKHTWDTSDIETGTYFVYASINDSINPNETFYWHEPLTIISNDAPIKPTGLDYTTAKNTIILFWNKSHSDNVGNYKIYYDMYNTPDYNSPSFLTSNSNLFQIFQKPDSIFVSGRKYKFSVTAIDSSNNESMFSNFIEVEIFNNKQSNHPFIIDKHFNQIAYPDEIYTQHVKSIDYDNEHLTFELKIKPTNMQIDQSGMITWKPEPDQIGNHFVCLIVSDSEGLTDSVQYRINVLDHQSTQPHLHFDSSLYKGYQASGIIILNNLKANIDNDSIETVSLKLCSAPQCISLIAHESMANSGKFIGYFDFSYKIENNEDSSIFVEQEDSLRVEYIDKFTGKTINAFSHFRDSRTADDIIYVPTDYPAIQQAIDSAINRNTIIVKDGTYTETVLIDKEITLKSENGYSKTTIVGSSQNSSIVSVKADYVTIDGFTIYEKVVNWARSRGISLINSNYCIIINNKVGVDANNYYNSVGIYLDNSNYNTILNNICKYCSSSAIGYRNSSSYNLINKNTFKYCNLGIDFLSRYNIIAYNHISNNRIGGRFGNSVCIIGNIFSNNETDGLMLMGKDCIVINNVIFSNQKNGITHSNGNILYLNEVSNNHEENLVFEYLHSNKWTSPTEFIYRYNDKYFKSFLGNKYENFNCTDINNDGIFEDEYPFPYIEQTDKFPIFSTPEHYSLQAKYLSSNNQIDNDMGLIPGSISISSEEKYSNIWISEESKNYSGTDIWTGQVSFSYYLSENSRVLVEIGYSSDGITFIPCGPKTYIIGAKDKRSTYTFQTERGHLEIPDNNYLAIRLTNEAKKTLPDILTGGMWSYVVEPFQKQRNPTIYEINPKSMDFQTSNSITITGSAFGDNQGKVLLGGIEAQSYSLWTNNKIIFFPDQKSIGFVELLVQSNNKLSGKAKDQLLFFDKNIFVGDDEFVNSIQKAVNISENGYTIIVKDGLYKENIICSKQLTIMSENGYSNCTIKAFESDKNVFYLDNNSTIRGFTIYGTEVSYCILGMCRYISGIQINGSNNYIYNNRLGYDNENNNYTGIQVKGSHNRIENNLCVNNLKYGILIDNDQNLILNNICMLNDTGIRINADNNMIVDNVCKENQNGLLLSENAEGNIIFKNQLLQNDVLGIVNQSYCQYQSLCNNKNIFSMNSFLHNKTTHIFPAYFNPNSNMCSSNIWYFPEQILFEYNNQFFKTHLGNYYDDIKVVDSDLNGISDFFYDFPFFEEPDRYPLSEMPENYTLHSWFLDDNKKLYYNKMLNTPNTLSIETAYTWTSDYPMPEEITYSEDDVWTGQINCDYMIENNELSIELGYFMNGEFIFIPEMKARIINNDSLRKKFQVSAKDFILKKGSHLALRIKNNNYQRNIAVITGGAFSFISPPSNKKISILTVSPRLLNSLGGTVVMIMGSGFGDVRNNLNITFGGIEAASYSSWTNDSIICVAPPHKPGNIEIEITNNSEELPLASILANLFYYDGDISVGKENKMFTTIQSAVNNSKPGNTIIVEGDRYIENIFINKPVTIKSDRGYTSTIIESIYTAEPVVNILTNCVTFDGFTVYQKKAEKAGVYIQKDMQHSKISNNQVGFNEEYRNRVGIYIEDSNNNQLINNICKNNLSHGIYLNKNSCFNTINFNKCIYNQYYGIKIESNFNSIAGNISSYNMRSGFYFFGTVEKKSEYNSICGNITDSNIGNSSGYFTDGFTLLYANNNMIVNNTFYNTDEYDINLKYESKNNIIFLNTFHKDINFNKDMDKKNTFFSPTEMTYSFLEKSFKNPLGNYYGNKEPEFYIDENNDGIIDTHSNLDNNFLLAKTSSKYKTSTWYFSKDYKTYRNDFSKPPGSILLPKESKAIFLSEINDKSSQYSFSGFDCWTGQIVLKNPLQYEDILYIEIGSISTDNSTFIPHGPQSTIVGNGINNFLTYQTSLKEFSIEPDQVLAIRIQNNSSNDHEIMVGGSWSYINEPSETIPQVSITHINQPTGSIEGGCFVSIKGSGFGNLTGMVTFGTTEAKSYSYWSMYEIICEVPPHDEGLVDINIKAANSINGVLKDAYLYFDKGIMVGKNQIFKTIQSAVNFAKENDTIIVLDGEYTENINISKPLTIKSESGYTTTIIIGNNESEYTSVFLIQSNDVIIDGFSIYNANYGIFIKSKISNCIIQNNQCGLDEDLNNKYGIFLGTLTHHNMIINNSCIYNETGIYLQISRNNLVNTNKCDFNHTGINIFGVPLMGLQSRYNNIWGNSCNHNRTGISISSSHNNIISKNICNMNEKFGVQVDWSSDNQLYLNSFNQNKEKNISIDYISKNNWKSPVKINYLYMQNECTRGFLGNYYDNHNQDNIKNIGVSSIPYQLPGIEPSDNFVLVSGSNSYKTTIWSLHNDNIIYPALDTVPDFVTLEPDKAFIWYSNFSYDYTGNDLLTGLISFTQPPKNKETFFVECGTTVNGKNFFPIDSNVILHGDDIKKSFIFQLSLLNYNSLPEKQIAIRIINNNDYSYQILTGGAFSFVSPPCQKPISPEISNYEIIQTDNKNMHLYIYGTDFGIKEGIISVDNYQVISFLEWHPMKIVCEIPDTITENGNIVLITSDTYGATHYYSLNHTLYVGQTHSFLRIQDAINNARNNDIIVVEAGTYNENIYIDKPITIKSDRGSYSTTIISKDSNKDTIIVVSDSVTIKGFTIYGATEPGRAGIYISTYKKNCEILNNICGSNINKGNDCGIIVDYNTSQNMICYNIFKNNNYGIKLDNSINNNLYCNSFNANKIKNIASNSSENIWFSPEKLEYIYDKNYYIGYMGNFYSNNTGNDKDSDGIIDESYHLPDKEPDDQYPLTEDIRQYYFVDDNEMALTKFLLLDIPESAIESSILQNIQCQILLNQPVDNDLVVSFFSSDTSEAIVPNSITITANNKSAFFDLTVIDDKIIDGTQKVFITASSSGYTPISAHIDILDNEIQNHAPVLTDQTFSVDENSSYSTVVGTVLASDIDNDVLSFYLHSSNTIPFEINKNTGIFYVKSTSQLDYEETSVYQMTIQVSDGQIFSSAMITININNLNDNKPLIIDQSFDVNINSENGFEIGSVYAEDTDEDQLFFSIIDGNTNNIFKINNQNGKISILDKTKLENNAKYLFTVEISDGLYKEHASINVKVVSDYLITKPKTISPQNESDNISMSPNLTVAYSSSSDYISHKKTHWQLSKDDTFIISSLIIDKISETNLKSYAISQFILDENKTYYWRARFYNEYDPISDWSEVNSFSTIYQYSDLNYNGLPDNQEIYDETIDLDNDNTADIYQSNTKCLQSIIDQTIFSIKSINYENSIISCRTINPESITTVNNTGHIPDLILNLKIASQPGDSVKINLYSSKAIPTDAKWFQYDIQSGWIDYSEYSSFNADRKQISFTLKDGVHGDIDSINNGIIIFPSGYGIMNKSEIDSRSSSKEADDESCFINILSY